MTKIYKLALLLWAVSPFLYAQTEIQGKLTDSKGEALPFAGVIVIGTSQGTSSNLEGIYSLKLAQGNYVVEFRSIGYKTKQVNVQIGNLPTQTLNVTLDEDSFNLGEVILGNHEDPAYAIIREAQKKRTYYLEEEFQTYQCKVYSKLFMKGGEDNNTSINFFGTRATIKSGVFYLSEAISEVSFEQKDKRKEKILSSLTSGDTSTYSKNYGVWLNFYQDRCFSINNKSFVSPIASDAFAYYDYKFEGSSFENGLELNKIKILPKYTNSPCFEGYIYIFENSWRIHSIDASPNEKAAQPFTMKMRQIYTPITSDLKGVWLPLNLTISFELKSQQASGFYQVVTSAYQLNPVFENGNIGLQTLEILPDSHRKDSTYWQQTRPVPLTGEEKQDYKAKQILLVRLQEKPVRDSIVKKENPVNWAQVIFVGYTHRNKFKRTTFTTPPLFNIAQFNAVEGLVLEMPFKFTKSYKDGKELQFMPSIRYGFANQRPQAKLKVLWAYAPLRQAIWEAEAGRYVEQWSSFAQIHPSLNTFYALGNRQNYMKIYEKIFVKLRHETELTNGLYASLGAEYAFRKSLENNTNYAWTKDSTRYERNIPQSLLTGFGEGHESSTQLNHFFQSNTSLRFEAQIRFVPAQRYEIRPEGKRVTGSKYPVFTLFYTKGLIDVDFDLLRLSMHDAWRLGKVGNTRFSVESGFFLRSKKMFFTDFQHFAGNRTAVLQQISPYHNFQLLDYYKYSTNDQYLQANLQHDFNGWLTDYIPFFKRAQTKLLLSANYLHTPMLGNYAEVGIGLGRLLRFLRIDWWNGFSKENGRQSGFTLGASF